MLLRELALRDGDETRQSRLGREQVVVARVEAVVAQVVADRQQPAIGVVEKVVVEVRQLAAACRELVQLGE